MGIRFECPNGHKLHVKAFLAGKRGICPECDAKFLVPAASGEPAQVLTGAEESTGGEPASDESVLVQTVDEPPAPPSSVVAQEPAPESWYVQLASGEQFGPANLKVMRSWVADGRVPPDSLMWRTGWESWKSAQEGLAELPASPAPAGSPPAPPSQIAAAATSIAIDDSQKPRGKKSKPRKTSRRGRRERARSITILLGALLFFLTIIFLVVLYL